MSEDDDGRPASIEEQRERLRQAVWEAPTKLRVLFLGRSTHGPTDIVAALRRALESVGHTVLHVDTWRHRDVLDDPTGKAGGHGPVYVRAAGLAPFLDRFRPQVVVCCAGGMVFAPADAAAMRERGILLLGITLGDPDAQPSILPHVDRFDYHTTNSVLAHERYAQAGVRNTLLLPFGIDRDFVTQPLAPLPEFAADVICIGHASGRKDRQEFMAALAKRFDVRVYGNGWPLPTAEAVHGTRLVQAARGGRFHVNFPATRAGHLKVKCGVFESVGAGGIPCSAVFDEMRRFFEYGREIVGYGSVDDLSAQLTALLADPDAAELMRRRAFERLVAEHLYEHRWLDLFAQIEADLGAGSPAVGAERAAVLRHTLARGGSRPRIVVLSGYYGAGNTGDDLLLESIAQGLERAAPDAHVHVAGVDAPAIERDHGRPAFDRRDLPTAEEMAARATAVVLGGGGLWQDYSFHGAGGLAGMFDGAESSPTSLAQLPLMAKVHRHAFHVFGMGVGPLTDPDAQAVVRFTADQADSVTVRDQDSVRLLQAIPGWSAPVVQAPDAVYALALPEPELPAEVAALAANGPLLALNLRPWPHGLSAGLLQALGERLEKIAYRHRLAVVGIPLTGRDADVLAGFLAGLDLPLGSTVVPWSHDPARLLGVLRGSRLVVSMRLHACLLSHRVGTPAIGLAYDPKVTQHFLELDRGDFAVELTDIPARLEDRVARGLAEQGRLPDAVRGRVGRFERAAAGALDELGRRIAASPVTPAPPTRLHAVAVSAGAVVPQDWDPQDVIDLSSGAVTGADGRTGAPVQVVTDSRRTGLRFHLAAQAPRRGDHASWRVDLDNTPGQGRRVEILLRQSYPERRGRSGRMAYQVLLDGQVLFDEDVTAWNQRNTVWLAWNKPTDKVTVEVRSVALRDCEPCGWGRAGAVTVEAARVLPWAGSEPLLVGTSSPLALRPGPRRTWTRTGTRTPVATAGAEWLRRRSRSVARRLVRR